jgi:hypothetical protein
MHTITTLIAIFVIVTAIALLTSGNLIANAEAVKTKIKHLKRSSTRGTTGGPGSLSKFISCIRGAPSSSTALGSTTTTGKVSVKLTRVTEFRSNVAKHGPSE